MLYPGRINQGTTLRVAANFQNSADADIDPTTVTFKLFSPSAGTTSYVYGTDAEISKDSTGDYYIDVTPTEAGRYVYRWVTTGTNQNLAVEGNFVVTASPFYDEADQDAYRS